MCVQWTRKSPWTEEIVAKVCHAEDVVMLQGTTNQYVGLPVSLQSSAGDLVWRRKQSRPDDCANPSVHMNAWFKTQAE